MKKLLLLALLLGTATSVMAQGRVSFRNTASTSFYLWTNTATGAPRTAGDAGSHMSGANGYRIGLYASTIAGATEGSLQLIGLATNSPTLAGRFLGPSPYALPGNFPASTPIVFQIRAWSFAGGLSWTEALAASLLNPLEIALGTSPLGTTTPTPAPSPAGELWGTSPGALTGGFEIRPVPEPSSIALGLLGLGAIALFRRRK
jgi:hypothetical protein